MSLATVPQRLHNVSLPQYSKHAIAAASTYMTLSGPGLAINFRNPALIASSENPTVVGDASSSSHIAKIPLWHPLPMSLYHELTISNFYKFLETPMLREDSYGEPGSELLQKLGTLNTTYFTAFQPPGWRLLRAPVLSSIEPVRSPHRRELSLKLSLWDAEYRPLSVMLLTGPNEGTEAPTQMMPEEIERAERLLNAPMDKRIEEMGRMQIMKTNNATRQTDDDDDHWTHSNGATSWRASSSSSFLVGGAFIAEEGNSSLHELEPFFIRQCAAFPQSSFTECAPTSSSSSASSFSSSPDSAVVPPWAVYCAVTDFATALVANLGSSNGSAELCEGIISSKLSQQQLVQQRNRQGKNVTSAPQIHSQEQRSVVKSTMQGVCDKLLLAPATSAAAAKTTTTAPINPVLKLVAHNVMWHGDIEATATDASTAAATADSSSTSVVEIAAAFPKFFGHYCTKPWEHSVGLPFVCGAPMLGLRCQLRQGGKVKAVGTFFFTT